MTVVAHSRTSVRSSRSSRAHAAVSQRAIAIALSLLAATLTMPALVIAQPSDFPIQPVAIGEVDAGAGRVVLRDAAVREDGALLLVADAVAPLAWFRQMGDDESGRRFEQVTPADFSNATTGLRAWLVRAALVSRALPRFPSGASLHTRIDSVGPGGKTAWLALGEQRGVRVGQAWWLRDAGQPIARLDVQLVERDVSFCRVTPLVNDPRLEAGLRPELWPAPADRRNGVARTAIVHVEQRPTGTFIWTPIPRECDAPAETHLDIFSGGKFRGHAVVEERSDRFWFARLLPALSTPPPEIGDDALVRTRAIIERRDFDARVFDVTAEGGLLNVGQSDNIQVGDVATIYREGDAAARVEVLRLQTDFAVAKLQSPAGFALRVGDVARWSAPAPVAQALGNVERVSGGNLVQVRTDGSKVAPLATPLALRDGTATVGVVLFVAAEPGRAIGFALKESLPRLPRVGDTVYVERGGGQ